MRIDLLVRAKRADNHEWVYGYYFLLFARPVVKVGEDSPVEIIPETICVNTNLMTASRKDIYENDICEYDGALYIVRRECDVAGGYWAETGFVLDEIGTSNYMSFVDTVDDWSNEIAVAIVGNKFDNPELLEK